MALAGHEFRYGAGEYLVFSMEPSVTARITRAGPFLAAGVRLRPELIAELLLESPESAARDTRSPGAPARRRSETGGGRPGAADPAANAFLAQGHRTGATDGEDG
ncbi:AraC family transcriptional regulator [Actinoplanes sp. TRM88002]|uniref:AraC family transcriptional regulator n=2 Tax=Paractinoplanes hotanensis TaxID=2906497 RepID=A0ABT0XVZ2_9ACTN|nr:AraC family transcriptional regulator N-terminal domain-containing protein [Actinoplanes hotanensis]MCM4077963.1 AraC family transcriptional regulator [Actinoplanes hotanensis]